MKKKLRLKNGKIRKNEDGSAMHDTDVKREKGCINPEFIEKHNLGPSTTPPEYANIFLPFKTNIIGTKEYPSFQQFTKWTNQKAHHSGASEGSTGYYKTFKYFSIHKIQQHMGLYIWHGLQPSPRVEYKFSSPQNDPLHGNTFIHEAFGSNAALQHKHFKVHISFL